MIQMRTEDVQQINISKVSIIVPTFNNEGTIEACVNSIKMQSYKNIEIILVDDGSTDNTGAICDAIAMIDERIKVIHQKNKGLSGARNSGMSMATSEYLCFVDGDDEIAVDYVEKMLYAREKTNADLVISGITFYEKKKTRYEAEVNKEICLSKLSYEEWLELFAKFQMIPAWNKLFKKRIIDENNLKWMEGLPCGEDGIFVFEYLKYCNQVTFIEDVLYYYYCFRSNTDKRFWPLYGQIKMFELKSELLLEFSEKDKTTIEKYQARKALHNIHDRIRYQVKKQMLDLSELINCYEYYWKYIEKHIDDKDIFDIADWKWLEDNRKDVLEGNIKRLYSKEKKESGISFKRFIGRKVRSYLS